MRMHTRRCCGRDMQWRSTTCIAVLTANPKLSMPELYLARQAHQRNDLPPGEEANNVISSQHSPKTVRQMPQQFCRKLPTVVINRIVNNLCTTFPQKKSLKVTSCGKVKKKNLEPSRCRFVQLVEPELEEWLGRPPAFLRVLCGKVRRADLFGVSWRVVADSLRSRGVGGVRLAVVACRVGVGVATSAPTLFAWAYLAARTYSTQDPRMRPVRLMMFAASSVPRCFATVPRCSCNPAAIFDTDSAHWP